MINVYIEFEVPFSPLCTPFAGNYVALAIVPNFNLISSKVKELQMAENRYSHCCQ